MSTLKSYPRFDGLDEKFRTERVGWATLIQAECLEAMKHLPSGSVDMVLCDLPYGTTQNKWDAVIPFEPLWAEYRRVTKPDAAIVLTASQPFTSALLMSNTEAFKYDYCWRKSNATGHLNAKKMPMRQHEDVLVFSFGKVPYYPQMFIKEAPRSAQRSVKSKGSYGEMSEGVFRTVSEKLGYPRSVLEFNTAYHDREAGHHPTQKPVALMEYLIRTYTERGQVVLDNTMGSGTTGVACINTGRRFIGIEREANYFEIACSRIQQADEL